MAKNAIPDPGSPEEWIWTRGNWDYDGVTRDLWMGVKSAPGSLSQVCTSECLELHVVSVVPMMLLNLYLTSSNTNTADVRTRLLVLPQIQMPSV